MAGEPHQELIIIKRHGGHGDGHHGGAWKIAFADFMTAMMALFLVLWLISATNPKQRIVIAHYFNPVKLAEVSVNKKGLDDPNSSGTAHGSHKSDEPGDKRLELPPMQDNEKRALFDRGEPIPKHDEATLLRDPYAVLSEIEAAAKRAEQAKSDQKAATASAATISKSNAQPSDLDDSFRDPFSTVPSVDPQQPTDSASAGSGAGTLSNSGSADNPDKPANDASGGKAQDMAAAQTQAPVQAVVSPSPAPIPEKVVPPSKDAAKNVNQVRLTAEQQAALDTRANEPEAGKVRAEIASAIHKDAATPGIPNVEVKSTPEGVLISVTDENNYAMFSVGSAEPQPKTIEIMGKVAQLLKSHQGLIVVRGHTDGRPYKSATYDNWQLSAARAQMAHYMLVHAGFDEKRIDRIEGYADHQLKVPNDPLAAQNRRIEILLRKDKP